MATVRYLKIDPMQSEPVDMGLDGDGRIKVGFNVIADKVKSETFESELGKVLVGASVGSLNTNIFLGSKAIVPDGDGPFVVVVSTGGVAGKKLYKHNTPGVYYTLSTAQVSVRARSKEAAMSKAWAAFNALTVVKNQDVTTP